MMNRYFILIDATLESHAPFFAQNPIFQPWLHSYDNIPDALDFISKITLPFSTEVYMARDNIPDDGLRSDTNGQMRTLLQTCSDLEIIHHVTVFSPTLITTDLEQQIRSISGQPRLIKNVISVVNLRGFMCREGTTYFNDKISRCEATKEVHLIPNFVRNRDELMEYFNQLIADQKRRVAVLVDERSNQPSEPIS